MRRVLVCIRVALCGALRVISGGNQVDGLPPAPSNNATGVKAAVSDQNYLWQRCASIATCSGSSRQIFTRLRGNQLEASGKVLPEGQGIPRHGSGDPLVNRFRRMIGW